jgi:hypothetical protein
MENKFTQEIKDKWVEALKSGNYIQTHTILEREEFEEGKKSHCCIGVLGCIMNMDNNTDDSYNFLISSIGNELTKSIWRLNDRSYNEDKRDYSNVIPLIETLEVQE